MKGPLGRSLCSFTRTAHSTHSLCSAPLCYACSLALLTPLTRSAALRFATLALLARSVHGLAHSLRSLPCGTVEIHESVFMLRSRSKETNAIVVVTINTPTVSNYFPKRRSFTLLSFFFFQLTGFHPIWLSPSSLGVFLLTTRIAFVPMKRDYSVSTYSGITTVP